MPRLAPPPTLCCILAALATRTAVCCHRAWVTCPRHNQWCSVRRWRCKALRRRVSRCEAFLCSPWPAAVALNYPCRRSYQRCHTSDRRTSASSAFVQLSQPPRHIRHRIAFRHRSSSCHLQQAALHLPCASLEKRRSARWVSGNSKVPHSTTDCCTMLAASGPDILETTRCRNDGSLCYRIPVDSILFHALDPRSRCCLC